MAAEVACSLLVACLLAVSVSFLWFFISVYCRGTRRESLRTRQVSVVAEVENRVSSEEEENKLSENHEELVDKEPIVKARGSKREGLRTRPVPVVAEVENRVSSGEEDNKLSENDEELVDKEPIVKARVLASSQSTGQNVYGFKTPKRKEALLKAAKESVHSTKKSNSKRKEKNKTLDEKTPISNVGKVQQKRFALHKIQAINLAGNQCDSNDENSSENSNETSDDENGDVSLKSGNNDGKQENVDLLDEYFQVHHSKYKTVTSDKTLSKLQNPKMKQEELLEHLKDVESTHIKETVSLHTSLLYYFDKWMFQLLCGFNVLLYGLGSKHNLLEQFRIKCLKKQPHIVVNGFFPNINIKQILNMITEDLLDVDNTYKNVTDQCVFIKHLYDSGSYGKLFLVIHNIDGHNLRSQTTQSSLAQLSSAKNIHVIASIDHINAPLVWDQNRASAFNWLWYDSTTFEPYKEETSYENSLLIQQSGSLALSSLTHVLRSLTPNAKGIFMLLSQHLLDNENNTGYQGISFTSLYARCRERFLVNSDLNLRAQLTEFKDHKLIKIKKGYDGVDYLSVALDCATIKQFMDSSSDN